MRRTFLLLLFILIFKVDVDALTIDPKGWDQINDKHFKVLFKAGQADNLPREILNKAEIYYSAIADRIGYARYQNFWTWDERVPIYLFSSQDEYIKATGRPAWSKGFAVSHLTSVNQRMIVTFKGQSDFLVGTLPHEISHLILHDFIKAPQSIPVWFDEGVAQLEEQRDDQDHRTILAELIRSGQSLPIVTFQNPGVVAQMDSRYASIFYAERLYIVDFLVKTYGKESFINLCRNLRDGLIFEEALKKAYYPGLDSLAALQEKWVQYMMQYL